MVRKTLVILLVLGNLVVFGGLAWVWYWAGRASSEVATIAAEELPSIDAPPVVPEEPKNFLLIGSDSREELPEDFPNFFGPAEGERADVIMVVRVDPIENHVRILSLPRDLRVRIPGHGEDKVNAAYELGGPDLMVKTVKQFTDLPIHHYVEMDFVGFSSIVDALGGVTMYFPNGARDLKSGLTVEPGCQELGGGMALAYARSRSYQELRDGSWVYVDADDLGRIRRQQRLIFAIIEEAKRPSTIAELGSLVGALGDHVAADSGLADRTLIQLAWDMRGIGPANVEAVSLPVEFQSEGGVSYVVPDDPQAGRLLDRFATDRPLATSPTTTREGTDLQVLNGNGREGAAQAMAELLEEDGFTVEGVGDAERSDYAHTLVVGRPEELPRAERVAEALGFGRVVPGEVPSTVDAIVIVGSDFEAPTAGSPSTTAGSQTTPTEAPTAAPQTTAAPPEVDPCG